MTKTTPTELAPVTRQAVAVKDRSLPGKVTGRLKRAIEAMVWEGLKRADAAEKAGLRDHSLRAALKRPHVLAYYTSECQVLRTSGRARRLFRLEELSEQNENRMAAVNAIRTAEGIDGPASITVNVGVQAGFVLDLREDDEP